jgi:hypothetical protein
MSYLRNKLASRVKDYVETFLSETGSYYVHIDEDFDCNDIIFLKVFAHKSDKEYCLFNKLSAETLVKIVEAFRQNRIYYIQHSPVSTSKKVYLKTPIKL